MTSRILLGLLALFFSLRLFAVDNPYQLTTEAQLPELRPQLADFWQQHAQTGYLTGVGGVHLAYAVLHHPDSQGSILVVNGRTESLMKYQATAYDLYQQGYSVYLYDHRGQGLSDRLLRDHDKGHVDRFDDYVNDLRTVMEQRVLPDQPTHLKLLAHSMGGAIALRYLDRWPNDFEAVALVSPMLGIRLAPLPQWLAHALTRLLDWLYGLFGAESPYAPGTGPYQRVAFPGNELSQSPLRYGLFRDLYDAQPQLRIGGPTVRWIYQSQDAAEQATDSGRRSRVPLLLIQAGADSVVTPAPQDRFCTLRQSAGHPCEGGRPLVIPGAWHDLFNEADAYRLPTLTAVLDFFSK